jgi:hypothetical protein
MPVVAETRKWNISWGYGNAPRASRHSLRTRRKIIQEASSGPADRDGLLFPRNNPEKEASRMSHHYAAVELHCNQSVVVGIDETDRPFSACYPRI